MVARYSPELRRSLVEQVERKKPTTAELLKILEKAKIPRSTFQYWWNKWKQLGDLDESQRGRPPAGFRNIVRQEVQRGLEEYFGDPPAVKRKARS